MLRLPFRWALVALLLSCVVSIAAQPGDERTALDEYIAKPDPSYEFHLVKTLPGDHVTTYVLEMTSQTWLTTAEVDKPVWKHWVLITKPDEVKHTTGLLYITGGGNDSSPPDKVAAETGAVAGRTNSVVTELRMVPNQPLVFAGETKGRKEDQLIAYTWDKFLRTGDPKWPARLPMTKAAVRALDTITAFCKSEAGGQVAVDKFVVCGGSKRGWTTWTTAAVDKRVVAIVPFSIDLLNIEPSFRHHWRAYGFWAPAVWDYSAMKLMDWNGTPEYKALMKIEEPYEYRGRLTMPKFIVNATGDQFFLPDSSQFYFDDLPGPKYLCYVPNGEHSMAGTHAPYTLLAYYGAILNGTTLPEYSWTVNKDDSIRVRSNQKPSEVKLWQASNPKTRDFRVDKIGRTWKGSPLAAESDGSYVGRVEKPAEGFRAFLVELTYANDKGPPLKFTSQVKVVPDVYPFEYTPKPPPK